MAPTLIRMFFAVLVAIAGLTLCESNYPTYHYLNATGNNTLYGHVAQPNGPKPSSSLTGEASALSHSSQSHTPISSVSIPSVPTSPSAARATLPLLPHTQVAPTEARKQEPAPPSTPRPKGSSVKGPPRDAAKPVHDNFHGKYTHTFSPLPLAPAHKNSSNSSVSRIHAFSSSVSSPETYLSIEIYNSKQDYIPLLYQSDPRSPILQVGQGNPYWLAPYSSLTLFAPPDYQGMVALGHGEGSKIESSFVRNSGYQPHFDVSYVDGFTHEVVCSCGGVALTGCNVDLFQTGECSHYNARTGVCRNPMRQFPDGPAHPFFQPCQGAAYTFPKDDNADHGCNDNAIQCCIGPDCEASVKQMPWRMA